MRLRIAFAAIATSVILGAVIVGPTFAGAPLARADLSFGYGEKPGWGLGDPNHEHGGPPGLEGKGKPTPPCAEHSP